MLMEDSELQELTETLFNKVVPLQDMEAFNSDPKSCKNGKVIKGCKDEIMSLLDKCKNFNVIRQKWSKPPKAYVEDHQDRLKQAFDMTMERVETWLPKTWTGLVKELRYEMKVAYDKFSNIRKRYSEMIETSREKQSELIKADIAKDIQDYVKYGVNLSLRFFYLRHTSTKWVRKIGIHMEMLARELEGLNVRNKDDVRRFAEDVSLYKQCLSDFANYAVSISFNKFHSRAHRELRQKEGVPFSDMIKRKINELGFEGDFFHLEDSQQDEVLQGINDELGREGTSKVQFLFVDFMYGDSHNFISWDL